MRKLAALGLLFGIMLGLIVVRTAAAQQFFNIPLFFWPLPDAYRVVIDYPDTAWTWDFLGLAPGMGCPKYGHRDYEASKPYWRTPGIPEDQDWNQASLGQRKMACYRGHAGTDIFAEPRTPVYAVADGTITKVSVEANEDQEPNGYVEIQHSREFRGSVYTWKGRYIHLMLNPPVTTGPVRAGQLLGYVAEWGTNTHLHMEFDDLYDTCVTPCITNPWGPDVLWIDYDDKGGIDPATDFLPDAPFFSNLVRNEHFDAGLMHWAISPGMQTSIIDGTAILSRAKGGDLAWMKQVLAYKIAPGSPLQVNITLANLSAVPKVVGVTVRDPVTWMGAISCVFALPAESTPRTYSVEGIVPAQWDNALLHLTVNPPDGLPGVQIDEVWVAYTPGLAAGPTRCILPQP